MKFEVQYTGTRSSKSSTERKTLSLSHCGGGGGIWTSSFSSLPLSPSLLQYGASVCVLHSTYTVSVYEREGRGK